MLSRCLQKPVPKPCWQKCANKRKFYDVPIEVKWKRFSAALSISSMHIAAHGKGTGHIIFVQYLRKWPWLCTCCEACSLNEKLSLIWLGRKGHVNWVNSCDGLRRSENLVRECVFGGCNLRVELERGCEIV